MGDETTGPSPLSQSFWRTNCLKNEGGDLRGSARRGAQDRLRRQRGFESGRWRESQPRLATPEPENQQLLPALRDEEVGILVVAPNKPTQHRIHVKPLIAKLAPLVPQQQLWEGAKTPVSNQEGS